jgi:hypothetical protein
VDEIGSEPLRPRRRAPAIAVVTALVIGLIGYGGDSFAQRRELDALVAQVASAQSQIAYSHRRITATVEYAGPLLFAASVQPRVRRGLQQLVADSAAAQVDDMVRERNRAAAVSVLSWHGDRQRARAALVRYLDGRVTYLRAVAADSTVLYTDHPELTALFRDVVTAFRAAAGVGQRERLAVVFAGGTHPTP